MILTQCAVCATDLGLTLGKKCGRCSTRYCGPECQVQHWKEGGHDQLCKPIKKAGGAEQYNANKKYSEAVTVAAEACADDTKGQTCYICTQAVHRHTKEGLVRMCACRGTSGFAHVSCLAEQAKILVAEVEENNLGHEAFNERWTRWYSCSLCEQGYHGVVACALGWACWKTYVGRPDADSARRLAMTMLGNGLSEAKHYEDALTVEEAMFSMQQRLGDSESNTLVTLGNLAVTYQALGQLEKSLSMKRDVYSGWVDLFGEEHPETLREGINYANCLVQMLRFKEAKALLRKTMPAARRVLGENHDIPLEMRSMYAQALCRDPAATLDDLREAVTTLEDTERTARRLLGGSHPVAAEIEKSLRIARAALRARDTPGSA
ncbi:unnamed protein product [Pelagomonas calceolata]|uniref:MYND-type domain-containing protein n=1 Tax=Pelagomonas calceolata TaxID=35677 RepID=A0A8J2SX49_9STRA|nr:unnamed protein product [Pelagomonas calceolata]